MTIYIGSTCAQGIKIAINTAILEATTPGTVLPQLLNGDEKVLVIEWNGPLDEAMTAGFDAYRGDGRLTLLRPGHYSYLIPPSVDADDAAWNIRAGVPFWLLNTRDVSPVVMGIGVLHPLFSSATVVFYDHRSRQFAGKMYFGDPRVHYTRDLPEGVRTMEEERDWIEEAGGAMEPSPVMVPPFVVPWY